MKIKIFWIIMLVVGAVFISQGNGFADGENPHVDESQIRDEAILRLRQIWRGQRDYYESRGAFHPSGCKRGDVCWQGQVLSSLNIPGTSNYSLQVTLNAHSTCPADLSVNTAGGDVRFRCRKQGQGSEDVWCFAYRCEQASPAGCKQLWRLRIKLVYYGLLQDIDIPLDCFDVGNKGVCSNAPANILPHNSCFGG